MKKIALCFFGLFRSFEKIWPLILKNFILEKDDQFDVFITTSNLNDKKDRYDLISKKYENINDLEKKIRKIVGNKLKILEIMNDENKSAFDGRLDKTIKTLSNVIKYQNNNDFEYDLIIFHRMDVLFVSWKIADNFYEEREIGEIRKKGILHIPKYNFPVGVKNHGCSCIQKYPNDIDVFIKLDKLDDNEMICYEDYWIGHLPIDFFICNSNLTKKILSFWKNYENKKYLEMKQKNKKLKTVKLFNNTNSTVKTYKYKNKTYTINTGNNNKHNSIHSYDNLNYKWFLDRKTTIYSCESQLRLFLYNEGIKLKQLRFNQNIAVLYIR